MNELTVKKDPAVLAGEIRTLQRQAQVVVLNYAIEIGRRLTEAKSVLAHGEWGDWLKNEVSFSQSTANNFMRIFERYGDQQVSLFGDAKSETLGNLPYTKALKLLAVPEDEVNEFMETHDVENMSTRELEQAIRERDAAQKALEDEKATHGNLMEEAERARKEAEKAQQEAADAQKKAAEIQKELEELQNRPVEVAVQAPTEEMMEEIRAAEAQKFQQEKAELEKRAEEAETKAQKQAARVKDLREKAEKAQEAAKAELQKEIDAEKQAREDAMAEKKAAEDRAAELERKLKMADSAMATFQVYFQSVQEDCNRMVGIIKKSDPEQSEKLKNALNTLLDKIGQQLG